MSTTEEVAIPGWLLARAYKVLPLPPNGVQASTAWPLWPNMVEASTWYRAQRRWNCACQFDPQSTGN